MTSRARWWPRAKEGRRVYANIRRFLLCALSGGSAEIAVMLAGPLLGLALPLCQRNRKACARLSRERTSMRGTHPAQRTGQ